MTLQHKLTFWIGTSILVIGFLYLFRDILLPFVLGAGIAYLLEPVMEKISRRNVPRWLASMSILILFFAFVLTIMFIVAPLIYRETVQLGNAMPGYIEKFWGMMAPYIGWLQEYFGNGDLSSLQDTIQQNIGKALKVGSGLVAGVASGGQAIVSFISICVITPIVAFFMMVEWQNMTRWIDNLLPRDNRKTIRALLSEIDGKISGFVRGQITIAFFLGLIYAIALTIAGLNFGFLIGLMAGVLSIIPLLGSFAGLIASLLVAWFQNGDLVYVGIIAAIFLIGQFIEGNILTPRILGESVGLHPLWILFALMAGGSMFGIVGMLIGVPAAAAIGVLVGFSIKQYKTSPYYKKTTIKKKKMKKAAS